MKLRQKQAIEAYQRAQDFVNAHPLAPPASYAGAKTLLDEVVAKLTGHAANQVAGGREGRAETVRQKVLARRLRELHLRPISKIAKAVLNDAPGIHVALRIPPRQLPVTRQIAEAMAMRASVTPYAEVFVANGRHADFLDQLDQAIDALRRSLVGRSRNAGTRMGAGLGITQDIRRGRNAVEMIDAVVTTHFADDLEVLGRWRSARRVQGIPGAPAFVEESAAGDDGELLPAA